MKTDPRIFPRTAVYWLVATMALGGCISVGDSLPVRYYSLETPTADTIAPGTSVIVGPLDLPGYLDRPQLVVREDGSRLRLLETERWAEPLESAAVRRVTQALQAELGSSRVVAFGGVRPREPGLRLAGNILRFEAAGDRVALRVDWAIADGEGRVVAGPWVSTWEEPLTAGTDAAALGRGISDAMGRLLDRFAARAAREIAALEPAG